MSQMKCEVATKENDVQQQKLIQSQMMGDMETERQKLLDINLFVENLKNVISSLQRDIRGLQDTISEQKVALSRCYFFACNGWT